MKTFENFEMSARCNTGLEENNIFDDEPYRKDSVLVSDLGNKHKNKNSKIKSVGSGTINYKGNSQKSIF